jgi:tRNA A-37 threonylcarbamoyl transferase component Bud32
MRGANPPDGYRRLDEGGTIIVARADAAEAIRDVFRRAPTDRPTLHGYASRAPDARRMKGREIAYALSIPGIQGPVVVRHNRHGGALRALTGDLFAGATRAPMELDISLALAGLGIPTPAVVGYLIYPAGFRLARSDVVTEEITGSRDLGALLLDTEPDSTDRHRAWNATRRLLKRLSAAGVRHHDLNVKNILIRSGDEPVAYALDVDRVEFDCTRRDAYAGNRARLRRSVEKWRVTRGATIPAIEIAFLQSRQASAAATTTSS